jgi:hypothetical protein
MKSIDSPQRFALLRTPAMPGLAALFLALVAGCSWTSFDDLEKETWVHSTDKPDSNSNDYGVAVQRGVRNGDGGDLIVIGAGQALYTELKYTPTGDADLDGATEQKLDTQFGIGNLDTQPILLADPDTDDISLIVNSGGASIAVLTGTHALVVRQIFGPSNPDSAIYMTPPASAAQPSAEPLVASADSVFGVFAAPPSPSPVCALVDGASLALQIKAIGAARITQTATDDVVIWNSDGNLLLYDGSVFSGCTGTQAPLAGSVAVQTGFQPGKGSTIETFGDHFVLLAGHHDNDTASEMLVFDVSAMPGGMLTPLAIGTPISKEGQRSAVVLEIGAAPTLSRFAVAGYPAEPIDGTVSGQVLVYPLDTTSGIDAMAKLTLNDSQPDANESFGRALAIMPFNNSPIIVVSADNEIFAYYRTDPLYGETRNPPPQ